MKKVNIPRISLSTSVENIKKETDNLIDAFQNEDEKKILHSIYMLISDLSLAKYNILSLNPNLVNQINNK